MDRTRSPSDPAAAQDADQWPAWVPYASAGLVFLTLTVAILQRTGSGVRPPSPVPIAGWGSWGPHYPFAIAVAMALLAFTPFLLDVIAVAAEKAVGLPLWLFPLPVLIGVGYLVFYPAQIDVAPFVLVFLCAEVTTRARDQLPIAAGTGAGSIAIMAGANALGRFDGSFIWITGIVFGWFGGFLIQKLDTRTEQLREAQSELTTQAAADERSRIAREIHDVIAHSMSVTMLHITAARMALERDRGADALDALREAEDQGRRSLNEIRRTVGLLGPDETATAPPMPTATDLPLLVADFRSAGLDVDLSVDGDVSALPPAAGLNLYRIVQESLSNVVKHAPGAKATVALTVADDIRLRVHNSLNGSRAPTGNGLGMRGMSERAAQLGGTIDAIATDDTWTVELVAPRPAS